MKIKKSVLLNKISKKWCNLLDSKRLDIVINKLNEQNVEFSPSPDKFFEFARLTSLNDIKIVIVGLDPYPNPNHAHGCAFSCLTTVPASLRNIYKAIENNGFQLKKPYTGNLTNWAKQGILLLNTALSTESGKSKAHISIWLDYIIDIIKSISDKKVIWMLWGNEAKSLKSHIKGTILEWCHPSPLVRNSNFTECNHFKLASDILKEKNISINWDPTSLESSQKCPCHAFFKCSEYQNIIFTDGGCYPNNKSKNSAAGYASIFVCGPFKGTKIYGNLKTEKFYASSIRAEGMALIQTFKFLKSHPKWSSTIIILDCEFWINMIQTYMLRWSKIDFAAKSNPDMTRAMWHLWKSCNLDAKHVSLVHMKSHNKLGWKSYPENSKEKFMYNYNVEVDHLATFARINIEHGKYIVLEKTC